MEAGRPFLVVGLGNPGSRYQATRHNIGFRLVDLLARRHGAPPWKDGSGVMMTPAAIGATATLLVKPQLYMNRSGDALAGLPEGAVADPERHLIVFDDVSLPMGSIRFRPSGGSGGHRGLESVLDRLGTEAVPRLRLGIGGRESEMDLADFVLQPFSTNEELMIGAWLDRAADGVRVFLDQGPDPAMNQFNR